MMREKFRLVVAMRPARRNSTINPYNSLLANTLTGEGIEVRELSWTRECFLQSKIIHFHWPDEFFVKSRARVTLNSWAKIVWLTLYRVLRRGRVVWTVHNVWPHDHRPNHTLLLRAFLRQLDGVIFLSKASQDRTIQTLPSIAQKAFATIPHGHYLDVSLNDPRPLGPNLPSSIRLGFFGQIRHYKNVAGLVQAVSRIPANLATLVVAGECHDSSLRRQLEELASASQNVSLQLQHLSPAALEQFVDGCHAIVLPYRNILNSGSALFALSRARPIMVPSVGSMPELQADVGQEWVFSYGGDFGIDRLEEFIAWLRRIERGPSPDLSLHDWSQIARETAHFYETITKR